MFLLPPSSSTMSVYNNSSNETHASAMIVRENNITASSSSTLEAEEHNATLGSLVTQPEITDLEIVVSVFLGIFILFIIIGNTFVILSVMLFREMRTLTNCLIVSLASADLLVAIVVLPISLHHEIMGIWTLGPIVCDFWITSDVFCCTASILNIVVIAVDRYWLITKNVRYTHNTTFPRQRVCLVMTLLAWVLSGIISSSPLFGWKSGKPRNDAASLQCIISQDLGYTIFSTFGAFWFPLVIILIVYFKIFQIARKRARVRAKARAIHPSMNSTTILSEHNGKSRYSRPSDSQSPPLSPRTSHRPGSMERRLRQRSKTRSSARTLGLIIGGFVLCWLPFFVLATVLPFCAVCEVPPICMSVVLWLGYSNSLLNPAIYAIWDKNFRRSFKRLSTCDIRWSSVIS